MEEKSGWLVVGGVIALGVAMFVKSAWDEAKKQQEEAAKPRVRWTDKNRWE